MEHTKPSRSTKKTIPATEFDLPINGKSYAVSVTPFTDANGDIFFRLSYNEGPVHVFGWDEGLNRYAEIDQQADVIPPVVELAIADTLNEYASQFQDAA